MLGKSMLKSWSTSQSVIALSSGEAELYALMRLATQTLGIMSMAKDFGDLLTAEIQTDSSAAMGMAHRAGLGGKSRHIDVQYLWIQDCVKSKEVSLAKVHTDENIADVLTKYLGKESFEKHLESMGYTWLEGRASEGRSVANVGRSQPEDTRARRGASIRNTGDKHYVNNGLTKLFILRRSSTWVFCIDNIVRGFRRHLRRECSTPVAEIEATRKTSVYPYLRNL